MQKIQFNPFTPPAIVVDYLVCGHVLLDVLNVFEFIACQAR